MTPKIASALLAMMFIAALATDVCAQTQEQVQENLVDMVNKAKREASSATEKFTLSNTSGGCADLRAAATDTAASLALARQVYRLISQNSAISDETRGQMLQDVQTLSLSLIPQKQSLDTQLANRCN